MMNDKIYSVEYVYRGRRITTDTIACSKEEAINNIKDNVHNRLIRILGVREADYSHEKHPL